MLNNKIVRWIRRDPQKYHEYEDTLKKFELEAAKRKKALNDDPEKHFEYIKWLKHVKEHKGKIE